MKHYDKLLTLYLRAPIWKLKFKLYKASHSYFVNRKVLKIQRVSGLSCNATSYANVIVLLLKVKIFGVKSSMLKYYDLNATHCCCSLT